MIVGFSGHGVALGEKSYLCPSGADLEDPAGTMVPLESVYERLDKCRAAMKLFLVDACRNDPRFAASGVQSQAAVSTTSSNHWKSRHRACCKSPVVVGTKWPGKRRISAMASS